MRSASTAVAVLLAGLAVGMACLGPGTLRDQPCQPDGRAVIRASCLTCHSATLAGVDRSGAPVGVNFDTDGDIQRHADRIRQRALVELTMPPTRALAPCNRDQLSTLLDALAIGPCLPGCSGRGCGDDGCGGSCGNCLAGQACDANGQCQGVSCTPSCAGAACGGDGCGGSCGTCGAGLTCSASRTCVCSPTCTGKSCGPDGCGASCGTCATGQVCSLTGACICSPSCSGKACGPDGCGGACGTCAAGLTCDASGQCTCVPSCTGRTCGPDGCGGSCGTCGGATPVCNTSTGRCVTSCAPSCTGKVCGDDGCGGSCGTCGTGLTCSAGQCICQPNCSGRQCGPDGCGGTCGTCSTGLTCSASGTCGCSADCSGRVCGGDGCGGTCGSCSGAQFCDASGQCLCAPACSGKQCGPDGCGGACGTCANLQTCDASGQCAWQSKSYAADVAPIFVRASCSATSCHGGARPASGLDLSTVALGYAGLVNVASQECTTGVLRVKPGDVAGSYLVNKLTGQGMCLGSQMPKGGAPLPAADLDVVKAWIGSGAVP